MKSDKYALGFKGKSRLNAVWHFNFCFYNFGYNMYCWMYSQEQNKKYLNYLEIYWVYVCWKYRYIFMLVK